VIRELRPIVCDGGVRFLAVENAILCRLERGAIVCFERFTLISNIRHCRLVITHPRGASLWVDERLYDGHTSLTAFMRAGRRKIRVGGLPGYKDDEESVVVVAASIADFERHLTKTK
jgi:hypothetical protein